MAGCSASRPPARCRRSSCDCTVVEFAPRLMALQVDEGGGEALRRLIEAPRGRRAHRYRDGQDPRAPRPGDPVEFTDGTGAPRRRRRLRHRASARATSSPAPPASPSGSAAASSSTTPAARATRTSRPSARSPASRAAATAWSPPATRWPRSSPTGCSAAGHLPRRGPVHQAQAPRRRRRQLRRRLRTRARRAGDRHLRPRRRRLQEARPLRRRPDAARRHPRRRRDRVLGPAADGRPRAPRRPRGVPPPGGRAPAPAGDLPDEAAVCSCNNVSAGAIRCAVTEGGCTDLAGVKACTKAGTSCGSCLPLVKKLVTTELEKSGVEVSKALCEHFDLSRAELFDVVRVRA